jgi:disulfide bond formation protein DsbB
MDSLKAEEPGAVTPAQAKSWVPTRKWATLVITGFGTIATSWVLTGWGDDEWLAFISLCVMAATTYLVPNSSTNTNSP